MAVLDSWLSSMAANVQNGAATSPLSASPSAALSSFFDDMPSLRTLSKLAFGGANLLLGPSQQVLGSEIREVMNTQILGVGPSQSCPSPQLSCHNNTAIENLCCFNYPGGQLLQTQFWDTHPPTGPDDSWTLHGLWPDRCDGSYDANCDSSRVYHNISAIITSFGKTTLLEAMSTYWKDYKGDDETFWQHEWSKHGTCISTLEPQCYAEHTATQEVVDYFQKAVDLFQTLPSYQWLADAGIVPSTTATYTFAAIQAALAAHRPGVEVTLGCKSGRLNEIWYHYDVRGSLQSGEFVPADPDGTKSSCPRAGIKYLPKSSKGDTPKPSPTTTGSTTPPPTSVPGKDWEGKGFLKVQSGGADKGCIISKGTWYTSGTCATFTASVVGDGVFVLESSKGKCGVVGGAFTCGGSVRAATGFTAVEGRLAAGGNGAWSADQAASGSVQEVVYAGSEHGVGIEIVWQGV